MIEKYIVSTYCENRALQNRDKVILTFITHEYCSLMLNWYRHLEKIGLKNNVLVIGLDQEAFNFSVDNNISCLLIDQNAMVEDTSKTTSMVKRAYIEKHHICKALCFGYITERYNTCILHSDIDMIFLKDPFLKIQSAFKKNYDMSAYMDKSYEEVTSGNPNKTGGPGFIIFYVTPSWLPKFTDRLSEKPFLIDSNDVGLTVLQEHFDNIKVYLLNSFLFTNYDIWSKDNIREKIKNICYCVHYNTSENTWMCDMTYDKINGRNSLKIERMKQYGHWLL